MSQSESLTDAVLYAEAGNRVTITLNQPDQLNALGTDLVDGLHAALDRALEHNSEGGADSQDTSSTDTSSGDTESQRPAKLIVFQANGKGFSGGLDLSGLDKETDGDLLLRLVRIEQLLQRVRHANCATAVFVHGACYGAAADLVLACRTRVATPDARFLMPGMRFGIVLGTRRLRDTIGESAAYQLLDRLTPFKSDEALATGFLSGIAEKADWPLFIDETLSRLSGFTASAYAHRVASLTDDTRADDMRALVTSVTDGSITSRMRHYVAQVNAERKARRDNAK